MSVKYTNIQTVVGDDVTFANTVKYLTAGLVITNMKSGTATTIKTVYNDTQIELTSSVGFENETTAQIIIDNFDGEILSRFLPDWVVTEDLQDFLDIFSIELNDQWGAIASIASNINPDYCKSEMLPILAASFGIPLDADYEEEVQRNFIKGAQFAYRYKGSKKGIEAAFRALGYDLELHEYFVGKYVNQIDTITDLGGGEYEVVLETGDLKVPTSLGQFSVADMISESEGFGSNTAVQNPGNWMEVLRVIDINTYVVNNLHGTGLTNGMNVVFFARNVDTREVVNADFDDTDVNEFPLMSSFIKGVITDRRSGGGIIGPVELEQLKEFLNLFLSSHARLAGAGLETIIILLADFREEEIEFPESPEAIIPYNDNAVDYEGTWDPNSASPPSPTPIVGQYWYVLADGTYTLGTISNWLAGQWAVYASSGWEQIEVPIGKFFVTLIVPNIRVSYLDDNRYLEETRLDTHNFLECTMIINYQEDNINNSESITLAENWIVQSLA